MKKIVKLIVIATLFVMCFVQVACMGCGNTTTVPEVSESTTSETVSENVNDNVTSEVSSEETAYQEWKEIEVSKPAFGETGANIGAGELLERAVRVEKFITQYPDSQYRDEAVEHYNSLVTAAITGGYVSGENNHHLYLEENGETFSSDVVTEYDTFVNNYGDTQTAAIVKEYTTLIGDADGSFTDDVKGFYNDLVNRLKDMFNMNGVSEGMNGGSAGGNNQTDTMGTQGNTATGTNSGQSVQ